MPPEGGAAVHGAGVEEGDQGGGQRGGGQGGHLLAPKVFVFCSHQDLCSLVNFNSNLKISYQIPCNYCGVSCIKKNKKKWLHKV